MSVLVNLEIPVKKERIEDFFDYLRDILVDTRAYEGCIRLDTYHEMENSKVLLIEEWEKIENQESYMQWRNETGLVEALEEFKELCLSSGTEVCAEVTGTVDRPSPNNFIKQGKVDEIKQLVKSFKTSLVIFNTDLSLSLIHI